MVTQAHVYSERDEKDMSTAGLKAFFHLADKWDLSVEQRCILLGCKESTYYKWKRNPDIKIDRDKLERISYLLGIHKSLRILFTDPRSIYGWIKKPNDAPLFNGQSALDRMLSGRVADLYEVRKYLDAERGGW